MDLFFHFQLSSSDLWSFNDFSYFLTLFNYFSELVRNILLVKVIFSSSPEYMVLQLHILSRNFACCRSSDNKEFMSIYPTNTILSLVRYRTFEISE